MKKFFRDIIEWIDMIRVTAVLTEQSLIKTIIAHVISRIKK